MRSDEAWYNHYFRDEELIVVFTDRSFERRQTQPAAWSNVVEFGVAKGIPRAELDFEPRTISGAEELFGVSILAVGLSSGSVAFGG
jgi:hypothetical protein